MLKKYLYSEEENHICDAWREKGTIDQVMKVFDEVVFELWVSMGDSTMNKSGYTNATVFFHKDIMGIDRKKVEEELNKVRSLIAKLSCI